MNSNPSSEMRSRRNSMRRVDYDYTSAGAYFITICAGHGRSHFGRIIEQEVRFNPLGQIANTCWLALPKHHPHIVLDPHVVMPNHMHGILWITHQPPRRGMMVSCPLSREDDCDVEEEFGGRAYGKPVAASISVVVGSYKAAVTYRANKQKFAYAKPLWQRNFWDRIIRSERELAAIRDYIQNNPSRWLQDKLHPKAAPNQFNRGWR